MCSASRVRKGSESVARRRRSASRCTAGSKCNRANEPESASASSAPRISLASSGRNSPSRFLRATAESTSVIAKLRDHQTQSAAQKRIESLALGFRHVELRQRAGIDVHRGLDARGNRPGCFSFARLCHREWRTRAAWSAVASGVEMPQLDRKSTRLNSSHVSISYAVFCLKKK